MKKHLISFFIMHFCMISAFAFSGAGSGTKNDPYRIFNADQLNEIRYDTEAVYQLEADIDLSSWIEENNPSQGWNPIPGFSGELRGNNHSISNLVINRKTTDKVGLFSDMNVPHSRISDISIINAIINGQNNVGCLMGKTNYFSGNNYFDIQIENINIINCSVNGINNIGLLAGYTDKYTSISDCFANGYAEGNDYVGGIIGYIWGYHSSQPISKCNANVHIKGNNNVGGICGYADMGSKIQLCSVYGNIIGSGNCGGISGNQNSSDISQCISACTLIKGSDIAGITGEQGRYCSISSCFCVSNTLEGLKSVYRIGAPYTTITFSNNYAWTLTKMILNGEVLGQPEDSNQNGTNIGLSALKRKSTYAGVGWDFENDWDIIETESFPFFKNQTPTPTINTPIVCGQTVISGQCATDAKIELRINGTLYQTIANGNNWSVNVPNLHSGDKVEVITYIDQLMPSVMAECNVTPQGEGTALDPYKIYESNDLLYISEGGHFELMNDIDLSEWITANSETDGWIGIDGRSLISLDGNGHTISGLWSNLRENTNVGLFSELGENSTVKSLNIVVSDKGLTGNQNTGVIAGTNRGRITQCAVSGGGVVCYGDAGAIAGISYGVIDNCSANNDVKSYNTTAAGIVGRNFGIVKNSLASGNIKGDKAAGIAGINSSSDAQILNCVVLNSDISGLSSALRIVSGLSDGASVPSMNNYASESVHISLNGINQNISEDPVNGKTLTASECKDRAIYESMGWDFNEIWGIDNGYSYPYLQYNKIPVTALTLNILNRDAVIGDTFTINAEILPENATNKTIDWSSSNENIASVDSNGNVTILNVGNCVITASSTDGSDISSECHITATAGIDSVLYTEDGNFEVFNAQGIKVLSGSDIDSIKQLQPGIYIIRNGHDCTKIIIQ